MLQLLPNGNTACDYGNGRLAIGQASVKVSPKPGQRMSLATLKLLKRPLSIVVDTPGFDDEELSDSDALKMLVDWLVETYKDGRKLSGILYLHRITDARMRASAARNLSMFRQLIGDGFQKNVTLGTSCWSLLTSPSIGWQRENELKAGSGFWKKMIDGGARSVRVPDDVTEAKELVHSMAGREALPLETQRQVVDLGVSFENLAVTKTVNHELDQARRRGLTMLLKIAQESQQRAEREERARQLELERVRERNRKWEHLLYMRRYCSLKAPYGRCDKSGCNEKLRNWAVVFRKALNPQNIGAANFDDQIAAHASRMTTIGTTVVVGTIVATMIIRE
jgi:hypothetical protein